MHKRRIHQPRQHSIPWRAPMKCCSTDLRILTRCRNHGILIVHQAPVQPKNYEEILRLTHGLARKKITFMQQYGSSFNRDGISPWVFMPDSVENRFEVVLLPWQSSNIQRKNGRCHRDYHRADQGVQGSAFSASPGSECCRSPVCHWPCPPGPLQQNAVKCNQMQWIM